MRSFLVAVLMTALALSAATARAADNRLGPAKGQPPLPPKAQAGGHASKVSKEQSPPSEPWDYLQPAKDKQPLPPKPQGGGLAMGVTKERFKLGEPVEFVFCNYFEGAIPQKPSLSSPNWKQEFEKYVQEFEKTHANITGNSFVIERKVDNTWREFYTFKAQHVIMVPVPVKVNPYGAAIDYSARGFDYRIGAGGAVLTWAQKDNEGTRRAEPGEWRLKFVAPYAKAPPAHPLVANFTIVGPYLELTAAAPVFAVGETVRLTLRNGGNAAADCQGYSYVIQQREGTRGIDFFWSRGEPLGKLNLKAGDERAISWDGQGNVAGYQGVQAAAGQWRIRFTAPDVRPSPVEAVFQIRGAQHEPNKAPKRKPDATPRKARGPHRKTT